MSYRDDLVDWDLWPSVTQLFHDDKCVGLQLNVRNRIYDIDVAYGPDRPPHCSARIDRPTYSLVCALWPNHDGPHVAATEEYMREAQFTIVGMRTHGTGWVS